MSRQKFKAIQERRSVARGGYVVHSRQPDSGLLRAAQLPIEHATFDAALAEARRLAETHGREFVVFAEVGAILPPAAETPVEPASPAAVALEQAAA